MTWVLAAGAVWLVVAVLAGIAIGRGIRLADRKQADVAALEPLPPNFVVDPQPLPTGSAGAGPRPPAPRPPTERTSPHQRDRT